MYSKILYPNDIYFYLLKIESIDSISVIWNFDAMSIPSCLKSDFFGIFLYKIVLESSIYQFLSIGGIETENCNYDTG